MRIKNQKLIFFNQGFTLIEILVVIAIIGILATISIVSLNGARNKAYDAQIKSDLSQFRTAMELAYETGIYTGATFAGVSSAVPPTCSTDATYQLVLMPATGDVTTYVAYANLCASTAATDVFCVDSAGNAKVTTVPAATATVCPTVI